jgi:hypothetical protein
VDVAPYTLLTTGIYHVPSAHVQVILHAIAVCNTVQNGTLEASYLQQQLVLQHSMCLDEASNWEELEGGIIA